MMRYKAELQQVSLQEKDKQKLLAYIHQEEQRRHQPRRYRFACLVLIGICLMVMLFPKTIKEQALALQKPQLVYQRIYEPAAYIPIGGAAFGLGKPPSQSEEFLHVNQAQLHDTYDLYDQKQTLPVYRYERIYDMKTGFPCYEDTFYQERIKKVAAALGVVGTLQTGTSRDIYHIENDDVKIVIMDTGDICITAKNIQFMEDDIQNVDLLAIAQSLYEKCKTILSIDQPSFRMELNRSQYTVSILEYENADLVYYHEDTDAKVSVSGTLLGDDAHLKYVYCPQIIIYYHEQESKLGEYPILSAPAAQKLLLQGKYIAFGTPEIKMSARDVVGWQLLYSDENNENFLPYRIPIYRFYVMQNDTLYYMDVPALPDDEIKKLDDMKTVWKKD